MLADLALDDLHWESTLNKEGVGRPDVAAEGIAVPRSPDGETVQLLGLRHGVEEVPAPCLYLQSPLLAGLATVNASARCQGKLFKVIQATSHPEA